MKKLTLLLGMMLAVLISSAQSIENESEKSPELMVGADSNSIEMEYARFNSYSEVETWQRVITPDIAVFYC